MTIHLSFPDWCLWPLLVWLVVGIVDSATNIYLEILKWRMSKK